MSAAPYDLVRAEDPDTGAQITITRAGAKSHGLKVLDSKDAVDAAGLPLPAKPRTDKAGQPTTPKTTPSSKSAPQSAGKES
ncbi:hypothetical protein [Luteipulveratus halotolerans]|uniref:Uncharacterized protein n=1 Tax=Luteipulveratus halotolerans TaxID=1631356 RepID=A0A0L6CJX5_9MICO|nr:hypothetical protein [Luteipulveratus halotolerans]KNX38101.1 hypothetical protein VV01_14655 [Luteipulveratus halotolerans]